MSYIVHLGQNEMEFSRRAGEKRYEFARDHGYKNLFNLSQDEEKRKEINVWGAQSEMAACKFLNKYFDPMVGVCRRTDIIPNIEVRSTTANPAHLSIYPKDELKRFFILVRHLQKSETGASFEMVGYMLGIDGATKEFWREAGDGRKPELKVSHFFIPESRLKTDFEIFRRQNGAV